MAIWIKDAGGKRIKVTGSNSGVSSFNGRLGAVDPQEGDYTAQMVGARPDSWTPTAAEVGAVPSTLTINDKPLTNNLTLTALDIGTSPITYGTTDLTPGVSALATGTVYLVYE